MAHSRLYMALLFGYLLSGQPVHGQKSSAQCDGLMCFVKKLDTVLTENVNKLNELDRKMNFLLTAVNYSLTENLEALDKKVDTILIPFNQSLPAYLEAIDKKIDSFFNPFNQSVPVYLEILDKKIDSILNPFNQSEYMVFTDQKTFSEARAVCQTHGSDLLSLNSVKEYDLALATVYNSGQDISTCVYPNSMGFWTSAQKKTSVVWVWGDTNNHILTTLWDDKQPSGDGVCAHILSGHSFQLKLNDLPCTRRMCFICEK